jgi:hypothetical protein
MSTPFRYYIARPKQSQAQPRILSEQMARHHFPARHVEEGRKEYELKREWRLIRGMAQEGPNEEHELRMYKVERILDARSIDLQKLAVWQNRGEAAILAEETVDHAKIWNELVQEIAPHLASQHRQLQQIE